MALRVPLVVCFLALLVVAVGSIGALVGILDALLASEAERSAVAAVNGALDHAAELVAAPFVDAVPIVQQNAALARERGVRCDDGRSEPSAMKPQQETYLAQMATARVPIFAVYRIVRVTPARDPAGGPTGCGCGNVVCFFYFNGTQIYTPARWPNTSQEVVSSSPKWSSREPFALRALAFRKNSALSRTGEWEPLSCSSTNYWAL